MLPTLRPKTLLALPTERVTRDPPEPLLYLVPDSRLCALYSDLGSLRRLSSRGREILQQSCAGMVSLLRHGIATPIRELRQTPGGQTIPASNLQADPLISYAVQAESRVLQGDVIELAQRRAIGALIDGLSEATAPDWHFLAGREIRAWVLQHELLLHHWLPEIMLGEALLPATQDLLSKQSDSGATATLNPQVVTRLFLNALDLPETLASYKIVQYLGKGPVTASFLAQHVNAIDSPGVVLKILLPPFNTLPIAVVSEIMEHLRQIQWFPGVLLCDDLLVDDHHRIFVARYMHGGNLADVVADLVGSHRTAMIIRALADVCEALDLAHSVDRTHGAVSSTNILFNGHRFQLADFQSAPLFQTPDPERVGSGSKESTESARQKDIHDFGTVLQALWEEQPFGPPEWLTHLVRKCTTEAPQACPSASEILRELARPLAEGKESLVILAAGRERRRDRIHYDLDLGGQRVIEMLKHNLGDSRIGELCALWDSIGNAASRCGDLAIQMRREIEELFEQVGELASRQILGPELHGRLSTSLPLPLWFIYDPEVAAIPWELLVLNGLPLCQWVPFARSPRVWPENSQLHRAMGKTRTLKSEGDIRVLLISDPTGTLDVAKAECMRLHEELKRCCLADRLQVTMMDGRTRNLELFNEMQRSHVIHFAGHADFSVEDPADSALILKGRERLCASDLRGFWQEDSAPLLFFANACASGRSPGGGHSGWSSNATMGLGHAFLAAGVGTYVGTAWPVPDDTNTEDFASVFYRYFFSGYSASRAMMAARNASCLNGGLQDLTKNLTWARYILFGHPLNRIELLQRIDS